MSLKGHIEDIPLVEAIQMIALARKTGTLTVRASLGEGGVAFHGGRIVAAHSWASLPLDPRAASLEGGRRSALLRERIAMALDQLLRLRDGQFEFVVSDAAPRLVGTRDVSHESVDPGVTLEQLLFGAAAVEDIA